MSFSRACGRSFSFFRVQDCPEFDLMFDNAFDQWSASSAGEKCIFVQILHHTCQRYTPARKPEFVNCQAKLMGGKKGIVWRRLKNDLWRCRHRRLFLTVPMNRAVVFPTPLSLLR